MAKTNDAEIDRHHLMTVIQQKRDQQQQMTLSE